MKRFKKDNHCKHRRHYTWKKKEGFLNCYDLAYAGRDTANTAISQLKQIAAGLTKKTGSQIDQIAQSRIQQAINQDGKKVESVAPQLITGVIE